MNHLQKIQQKIITWDQASTIAAKAKTSGKKMVFSNGCFDIMHHGHVEYLSKAADFGNLLMIGLNSDNSVRRLKGENRPLNRQNSRALLLAAMQFVDYVVLFDEDTPYELIKAVQPDVLVKGKDYKAADIVGYDIVTGQGGEVKTIDLVKGFSTSGIIEKIKKESS
ncbi:MAG: D-glycero-beta-D-manno-heptose 1-phosphate adenylyltransferase [Bacteroidales bacterium]|nr:D-glycero-beta-D-manno-heptose 1-phosphate adenylyltransferase [Bacteroidales bacterium]MCF8328243.1 D-glycero-beta-D-manno-heptose 1-phosphate adenylyltransferase [Bacteroidales bacterium]